MKNKNLFDKIKNIDEKELENCKMLLEKYSTFNVKDIISILELLITSIENDFYSFKETINQDNEPVMIIAKLNSRISELTFEIIKKLRNAGEKVLILNEKEMSSENITFFTLDKRLLKSNIDFSDFPYIEDFIISLVEYRFENEIEEIPYSDLWYLSNKYFLDSENTIEKQSKLELNKMT